MKNELGILNESKGLMKKDNLFRLITIAVIVANVFWGLVFSLLFFGCAINGTSVLKSAGIEVFFGGVFAFFILLSLTVVAVSVLVIKGTIELRKGEKKGFLKYAVGNSIWTLLLFFAARDGEGYDLIIGGVISLLLGVYFFFYSKRMEVKTGNK